jgi:predicted porin
MNNKIKLAVAGAVLSAASVANAGIIIPAGDWTLDVNGNVNAFMQRVDVDKSEFGDGQGTIGVSEDGNGEDKGWGMTTGLLPAWLGFTGTTNQNGIDVSFTISLQTAVSDNGIHGDGSDGLGNQNASVMTRQTFITFGTKDMGTVKIGKDLGIFASDAILSDMTLLGVGAGSYRNGTTQNTTFGGIGTGYQYAAWKGQVAYTTPNMNGFQATIGLVHPDAFQATARNAASEDAVSGVTTPATTHVYQDRMGYEGKASYSWTGDIAGKVWVSGASYDVTGSNNAIGAAGDDVTISAWDIGANITSGNLGLVGYYYDGRGNGITAFGLQGVVADAAGTSLKKRDGDGGYVQATYVIPTGTKLGLAYGVSNLDKSSADGAGAGLIDKQERWTVAAYHPLTKHLNLVAEYNDVQRETHDNLENDYDSINLGAILFF